MTRYGHLMNASTRLSGWLQTLALSDDPEVAQEFAAPAAEARALTISIRGAIEDLPEPVTYAPWQLEIVLAMVGESIERIAQRANLPESTVRALTNEGTLLA